jgi:hypothetical protein
MARQRLGENTHTMPSGQPSAKYLRLTEEANALDYLEKAYAALQRVPRRPEEWKWVVIGLHGALYGFAVCTLKGTNWEMVTHGPKNRLITFDEALRRCQKPECVSFFTHSKPLQLTADEAEGIRFLKGIRNQIEHYVPKHWSIELHGLMLSFLEALRVIRFLALEAGNARLNPDQRRRAKSCLTKAETLLRMNQLYKDHVAAMKRATRSRTQGGA